MRIQSIRVANLLSFGPEQHFDNLTQFNLLVGPNGSGKSNLLRVIGGIPINFRPINGSVTVQAAGDIDAIQVYHAHLQFGTSNINRHHVGYRPHRHGGGSFSIDYWSQYQLGRGEELRSITFTNGEHVVGDFSELARNVALIKPLSDDNHFLRHFTRLLRGNKARLALLNFGIYFIFRRAIFFSEDGTYGEIQSRAPGAEITGGSWSPSDDYEALATGIFRAAQLILRFLAAHDQHIVLIDEPEDWLEPRACRRLWWFIFWLSVHRSEAGSKTLEESALFDRVDAAWQAWRSALGQIWLGDQPEEPQIPFPSAKQLFIATHSSLLINEFLALPRVASIFNMRAVFLDNSHDRLARFNAGLPLSKRIAEQPTNHETIFSEATRVGRYSPILDDLGCHGADLLQTNGVIWVEGPSDAIFIQKWIDMYCLENGRSPLKKGASYEFQLYGGALLDCLCLVDEELNSETQIRKLVEMFSFSRNAYVVIDSDAIERDGVVVDRSSFSTAKILIQQQINLLNSRGFRLGLWFEQGNAETSTIEDYLLGDERLRPPSRSKTVHARRITSAWSSRRLSEFSVKLRSNIEDLVTTVESWQPG